MKALSQNSKTPVRHLNRILGSLVLATAALGPVVHAAPPTAPPSAVNSTAPIVALPDFTGIVADTQDSVVNIRTTAKVPDQSDMSGQDPYQLFRFFFGPNFKPPGGMPQEPQAPQGQGQAAPKEHVVPSSLGSGFIISTDGYILTNNHVVSGANDVYVRLRGGRELKAKVIGTDKSTDVALLKIDATGLKLKPLKVGNSDQLKKGQWVLAIGSPFGLDSTVTAGIVSAIGRDAGGYLPFIQTDVAVNPGNSGGPLLDLNGDVVGINSEIISKSGGFMGISLAIPINQVMQVVTQLREHGSVIRGRIGVQISEVSDDVAQALGLPKTEGAMVSMVEPGSPSANAGVQPGDVILKFDGKDVEHWSDLPRMVGDTKPGTKTTLEVWRRGKTMDLNITVDLLKATASTDDGTPGGDQQAPVKPNKLGLVVTDVTKDQQQKLHIHGGVSVKSSDDPASDAGIAPGDVILAVNNEEIHDAKQFDDLVNKLPANKAAGLLVRRGNQTQWVVVQQGN